MKMESFSQISLSFFKISFAFSKISLSVSKLALLFSKIALSSKVTPPSPLLPDAAEGRAGDSERGRLLLPQSQSRAPQGDRIPPRRRSQSQVLPLRPPQEVPPGLSPVSVSAQGSNHDQEPVLWIGAGYANLPQLFWLAIQRHVRGFYEATQRLSCNYTSAELTVCLLRASQVTVGKLAYRHCADSYYQLQNLFHVMTCLWKRINYNVVILLVRDSFVDKY